MALARRRLCEAHKPNGSQIADQAMALIAKLYEVEREAQDVRHEAVTCMHWDRVGLDDPGVRLSADGKRRLLPRRWQPQQQY